MRQIPCFEHSTMQSPATGCPSSRASTSLRVRCDAAKKCAPPLERGGCHWVGLTTRHAVPGCCTTRVTLTLNRANK